MIERLQAGKVPTSISGHEAVLSHYGVSSVLLAQEVARRMSAGELTWEEYGGTHPGPAGNALAAKMCGELLDIAWTRESDGFDAVAPHRLPPTLLDNDSYVAGRWLLPAAGQNSSWVWEEPDWEQIGGGFRDTFAGLPLLCGSSPRAGGISGQTAGILFEGTAFGAYVLAGPDAGIVECAVDAGPWATVDLYHRFSGGLHYPRTVMFVTRLQRGRHEARLRVRARCIGEDGGNVARVLQFAVS